MIGLARFNAPRPRPVSDSGPASCPAASQTRIPGPVQWGGMHRDHARGSGRPLDTAWTRLDWKTARACLFCVHAEKIDIGRDDWARRAGGGSRTALRHRYFRDRSRRPSAGRLLAIRQRQMARGELHPRRPRRVGYVFGGAREDARPAPQRDRSDRSQRQGSSGAQETRRSLRVVHGRGRCGAGGPDLAARAACENPRPPRQGRFAGAVRRSLAALGPHSLHGRRLAG